MLFTRNRKEKEMNNILFLFFIGVFSQSAIAEIMYTCTPIKPISNIREVVLSRQNDINYLLTIKYENYYSSETQITEAADYYDDMTYLGYYSQELHAGLEFDYPINLHYLVKFIWSNTSIYVKCK